MSARHSPRRKSRRLYTALLNLIEPNITAPRSRKPPDLARHVAAAFAALTSPQRV